MSKSLWKTGVVVADLSISSSKVFAVKGEQIAWRRYVAHKATGERLHQALGTVFLVTTKNNYMLFTETYAGSDLEHVVGASAKIVNATVGAKLEAHYELLKDQHDAMLNTSKRKLTRIKAVALKAFLTDLRRAARVEAKASEPKVSLAPKIKRQSGMLFPCTPQFALGVTL